MKIPTYFTGQETRMEKLVPQIWEEICDAFYPDECFTRAQIMSVVQHALKASPRTAQNYTYAVVAYLLALPEGGLFRVNGRLLRFHDIDGN